MSKDLNDFFVDTKSPEDSISQTSNYVEFEHEHTVYKLHERIKYQEL